jgi:hypothetical protein
MRRTVTLSAVDRADLEALRDHGPKPYLRERAAAILKVADGGVAAQVARTGLLRPHDPDTIYAWLDRYRAEGSAGLVMRPGRGRRPVFPPSVA